MSIQTAVNSEEKNRLQEAFETAGRIAETGIDIAALKKRVEYAVEDAVMDAERFAKQGKHALEDVGEDATYYIKKNPWQSVGYAAGAAFGVGILAGWLMTRRNGENTH
ncbi:MAG: hypothetical protein AB7V18_00030 [Pyrinomonadaceae bacterium]